MATTAREALQLSISIMEMTEAGRLTGNESFPVIASRNNQPVDNFRTTAHDIAEYVVNALSTDPTISISIDAVTGLRNILAQLNQADNGLNQRMNGLESSGKSLVGAHILAETQKKGGVAVYIDSHIS